MKKPIIYFLLSLIAFNSFGYVIVHTRNKSDVKKFTEEYLNRNKSKEKLITLTFSINSVDKGTSRIIWKKENREFLFDGNMYDITETKIIEDSIYYTCYLDEKENEIEKSFNRLFDKKHGDDPKAPLTKIIVIKFLADYLLNSEILQYNIPILNYYSSSVRNSFQNFYSEILTPPPQETS